MLCELIDPEDCLAAACIAPGDQKPVGEAGELLASDVAGGRVARGVVTHGGHIVWQERIKNKGRRLRRVGD